MKKAELEERMVKALDRLINAYFGENTIVDKMVNATLKIMVTQNMQGIDKALSMFENEDGEIDANGLVETYANQLGEAGVPFDIRDFVKNDVVRGLLPNKSLIIKKGDLMKILE